MPNKNWTLELDLTQVSLDTVRVATEGYYKGKIVDTFINDDQPNRVNFHVQITEGDFKGFVCRDSMMMPGTYSGKDNSFYWAQLLMSVGTKAEDLKGKRIPIPNGEALIGLSTHIYFKPGSRDEGTWNRMRFYGADRWAYEKKKFEAANTTTTTTIPTPIPAAAAPSVVPSSSPAVPSNGGGIPSATSGFAPQGSGGNDILALLNANN